MRASVLLLVGLLGLSSCGGTDGNSYKELQSQEGLVPIPAYNRYFEQDLQTLVDSMAIHGEYHSAAVGIGGRKSDQYKRFEAILSIASEVDLVKLTSHPSAVVRVYSFEALMRKGLKVRVEETYDRLRLDYAELNTLSGCLGMNSTVAMEVTELLRYGPPLEIYSEEVLDSMYDYALENQFNFMNAKALPEGLSQDLVSEH